jgi:uncharacterized Zn-finger protein
MSGTAAGSASGSSIPHEVIEVTKREVACDGGSAALGHPRVFLDMGHDDYIDCPYCGRRFTLKPGTPPAAGH